MVPIQGLFDTLILCLFKSEMSGRGNGEYTFESDSVIDRSVQYICCCQWSKINCLGFGAKCFS